MDITETDLSFDLYGTSRLTAVLEPADATDKNIDWESDNESVVTVDAGGNVIALAAGTAVITATTADGGFTDTCEVTVGTSVSTDAFITQWRITTTDPFTFPLDEAGTYDFYIDWGDGTVEYCDSSTVTHAYAASGDYMITVSGTCHGFGFHWADGLSRTTLDVRQWGKVRFHNEGYVFGACDLLTGFSATDAPDLSAQNSLYAMFYQASNFNGDISGWDTGPVVIMGRMFSYADAFNQDIGGWDTSHVANMWQMFISAESFDQDLFRMGRIPCVGHGYHVLQCRIIHQWRQSRRPERLGGPTELRHHGYVYRLPPGAPSRLVRGIGNDQFHRTVLNKFDKLDILCYISKSTSA